MWLLRTFVNSSCDIKIVLNCCRNLAVKGLASLVTHSICRPLLRKILLHLNVVALQGRDFDLCKSKI